MRGASYYRERNRRRRRKEIQPVADNVGCMLSYILLLPFLTIFVLFEKNTKSNSKTQNNPSNYKRFKLSDRNVSSIVSIDDTLERYQVGYDNFNRILYYRFYEKDEFNEETYDRRLYINEITLVSLLNNLSTKELTEINGVNEHVASHIILNRPYSSIDDALSKQNLFTQKRLEAWIRQLDMKGQKYIKLTKSGNQVKNNAITLESLSNSVTLFWEKVSSVTIRRNNIKIAELTSETSFTDKPLYSNEEYTYSFTLRDKNGNSKIHVHRIRTKDDGVAFRGLSPEAFDGDVSTSYKTSGFVTWEGDLANREIEIKFCHNGTTQSLIYFRDANNKAIPDTKTGMAHRASTSSKDIKTVQLEVPEDAVKIHIANPDTEIFDIVVIN